MTIEKTLEERGSRYGDFKHHARLTQELKQSMFNHPNYELLSADKKEALEMIMHKIGRIINGDPEYADSWTDIIGYARLVEKDLLEPPKKSCLIGGRSCGKTSKFADDLKSSTLARPPTDDVPMNDSKDEWAGPEDEHIPDPDWEMKNANKALDAVEDRF